MRALRVAVLTVSDRCAAGEREDASGPAVCAAAATVFGDAVTAEVVATRIVPDEEHVIAEALRMWVVDVAPDLVLTTGGTGLAPRDVTPEATAQVLERRHDALLELARRRCYEITPKTYLSRGVAGTAGRTLIVNLPGSPKGAVEMLRGMADVLPHAVDTLRGDVRDG